VTTGARARRSMAAPSSCGHVHSEPTEAAVALQLPAVGRSRRRSKTGRVRTAEKAGGREGERGITPASGSTPRQQRRPDTGVAAAGMGRKVRRRKG
jgi:hypothetical protein